MRESLQKILTSKLKPTLLFFTFKAWGVDEDDLRYYGSRLKVNFNTLTSHMNNLIREGYLTIVDGTYYWRWHVSVRPVLFLELALYMLEHEQEALDEFSRNVGQRNDTAKFLWDVARAYHEGKSDIASAVPGRFPMELGWQYLKRHFMTGVFNGYIVEFSVEELSRFVKEALVASLYEDRPSVQMFDTLNAAIGACAEKCEPKSYAEVDFLSDLVACYRYFYDGTVARPRPGMPTYPYNVMLAIKALYAGKTEESLEQFGIALKLRNKVSKDKNLFGNGLMSFYMILAYKKADTDDSRKKVQQFMNKKVAREERELRAAYELANLLGEVHRKEIFESAVVWGWEGASGRHIACLFEILAGYYDFFGKQLTHGIVIPRPEGFPEYQILRHEMSPYLDMDAAERARLVAVYGGPPILPTIRRKAAWETVLDDVARIALAGQKAPAENNEKERIGYFLNHDDSEMEVRIQSRLKSGKWSQGKRAGQSDFLSEAIPCMDESDKKVASAVRVSGDYFMGHVKVRDAMPFLVGSDRVYKDFEPVTVIEEKPYVTLNLLNGNILPKCNVEMGYRGFRKVSCYKSSKNIYSVVVLNDIQMKLLQTLMSMKMLPEEAAGTLQELFPLLSQHIEVHSNLLQGGSSLEKIDGESKIHIRIDPLTDEYRIRIFVHPLSGGNKTFVPGEGDKVIYDMKGGVRYSVSRSLGLEKENMALLRDMLETALDTDVVDVDEMYLYPSEMLELVEWATDREDRYVLEWPENKKIKVYSSQQSTYNVSLKTNEAWFDVEGEVVLKDADNLKIYELLSLVSSGQNIGNYIRLQEDTYLALTQTLHKQLKRLQAVSQLGRSSAKISRFNVGVLADIVRGNRSLLNTDDLFDDLTAKIEQAADLQPRVPDGLNAALRDYQYDGFRWMVQLDYWGAGACLADDMGLGKTVQTIAFLLYKASIGPSLVVAPASVVLNWKTELARFAPSLNVHVLNHQPDRQTVLGRVKAFDVVVTTYGLLPQEEGALSRVNWNVVCLDEAHAIKNRQTKMSSAAMNLKASSRVILTGTPMQNYLGELWNLLQFLNPGLLGSYEQFSKKFISNEDADMASLRRMVQPFILRRTKSQVLDELPQKTEIVRNVELSDMEMLAYENMRERVKLELDEQEKISINTLAEITRLRQAACSISLVKEEWNGGCSKIDALMELVPNIISGGNRVLIFSQFTSFLSYVTKALDDVGIEYFYLDGSVTIKNREKMVQEFQGGKKQIFVVSLKAGGQGLNLTGANYVIHLDPWWNPAIEQQATDRAHRIGQQQPVTVYRLISSHTIEEKILRLHKTKKDLADAFLEGTDKANTLSIEDLRNLVEIEK